MINSLNATHEIVNFKNKSLIMCYDNIDYNRYSLHCHPSIEIIMPLNNNYPVICNNVTYQIREGDILIIQPNVLHEMPAVHGRRFVFQISLLPIYSYKMYSSIRTLLPSVSLLTPEQDEKLYLKVRELLYTIYNEHKNTSQTAELAMYVSTLQILLLISKASSLGINNTNDNQIHVNSFISICSYINDHYAEKLNLEDVAKKCGFSKFHFNRLFKKFTNETFYQYLNNIRIKNAELLLTDFDLSITEVIYKSGFSTISSFNRMFKIYHNCTPTEFRKMLCVKWSQ